MGKGAVLTDSEIASSPVAAGDAGAFGAARLLRGLLAIATVPLVLLDRGALVSSGIVAFLVAISVASLALNLTRQPDGGRSLAVPQIALDIILALAISALTNTETMPLVWLALLVPVMTAGQYFGLGGAVGTWTLVSFAFAGISFGYGPNDYSNGDVLRLVVQQVFASVAMIGSVIHVARRNWVAYRQVASDRHAVTERLQHLLAIGDIAMRLAEADRSDAIAHETVEAALSTGFERVELWTEAADGWELLGSGGALPVDDLVVEHLLEREFRGNLAQRLTVSDLDLRTSRALFAGGYESVVALPIRSERDGQLRLLGYDHDYDGGQQQIDSLELIGGHVATAWHKSQRIHELDDWATRLEHEATHDQLTGLPNRAGLFEHLRIQMRSDSHALLFFDLNGFKAINDAHGHDAGDAVLRSIATSVGEVLGRDGRFFARLGGDEFVATVPLTDTAVDVLCEEVINAVESPIEFNERTLTVGTSIGVALPAPDETYDNQLRRADAAMYVAKAEKHSGSAWFLAPGGTEEIHEDVEMWTVPDAVTATGGLFDE